MIGKNQKKDQLVIIEPNKSEGDIKTDGDYYENRRLISNSKGCVVENFKDNISLDQTDIKAQASYYFKKVEKVVIHNQNNNYETKQSNDKSDTQLAFVITGSIEEGNLTRAQLNTAVKALQKNKWGCVFGN